MPKFIKGLAKYSNEMTKSGMLTVGDFTRMTNLAKQRLWQEVMNGLPNDMAKNGLLVISDFTRIANSNEMTNKVTLTITEFSKKANF